MKRQLPTTPYDAAAWYILWGIAFAALAGFLLLVSWSAPPRERLQTVSGEFEKADRSCTRRSGCWLEINLRTPAERLTLRQVDFAAATTALQKLRPGDHITALVAPLGDTDALFWELSRDWELLMPYDEAAAGFVDDRRSLRGIGYIIAAAAFIVLAFGIFHFIRVSTSDVAA